MVNAAAFARGRAEFLVFGTRGAERLAPGLHNWKSESRHSAAGHSHGPRNGVGVAVCGHGCVLGGQARGQCGGDGRHNRVNAGAGVRHRAGCRTVHNRDGGAADRREGSGGCGDCRSAVDFCRARHFAGARDSCGDLCAGVAARDGRIAGDRGERVRVYEDCAGRLRRGHHAVSE